MRFPALGLAALILCSALPAQELPAPGYDFRAVRKVMQDAVAQKKVAGISLLLIHRGKPVFKEAFGMLDIESGVPLATDSIVNLASSTKWISATAIMMLADEGKISLDDPVGRYFPDFADLPIKGSTEKGNPTFRQCLSHTAGFVEQSPELGMPNLTLMQSVDAIRKSHPELLSKPGTEFRYGGVSYQVAGATVERITTMAFETYLQRRIFTPLGMVDTTFNPQGDQLRRTGPVYAPQPSGSFAIVNLPPDGQNQNSRVAGGLYSTLDDYGHFLELHYKNGKFRTRQMIAEESSIAMRTEQTHGVRMVNNPAGTQPYGLGTWLKDETNERIAMVVSDAGLFGTYPWIDYPRELIAVVFTQTPVAQCRRLVEVDVPNAVNSAIDSGPKIVPGRKDPTP